MLTSFLYTEPLTSYSSRRLYLENSSLDLSSCCCLSFHWVVMLQSLPLRGQLSSSGLRFCHSFSFSVSMDFPPSWVGLLPLRKKISHSILSNPHPEQVELLPYPVPFWWEAGKSLLYSSNYYVIMTPNK